MSAPLPNRIRELREDRGLSQQALADLVGTSKPQIDRLEKGDRRLTDTWMRRIAAKLDVAPHDLLPFSDIPPREAAMLHLFRGLSDGEQTQLIRIASALGEHDDADAAIGAAAPPAPRRRKSA